MATPNGVWGIDVGQCALKALHCVIDEDGETVVADAFDYIEYPKILSQPDAEPEVLIREALKEFVSRNEVHRNKVAISVSGQSGLARYIKLPPVDAKKIPDIVRYEAKQQIPFDLEEAIWDYQQIGPSAVEEGFTLDSEVGLFAMKRDLVRRFIEPFEDTDIELDIIQLSPLCIYNAIAFERFEGKISPDDYDPDNPPESLVILSVGTDTTDLVITNGFSIWQRSIPLGGNHFTKQLTKDLKLTFAKAEHLKRNIREAENAKAILQAIVPTFNDMLTEIERSIRYFRSLNRDAKIGRYLALGNAVKLPGLIPYLSKKLEAEIETLETFERLSGGGVTATPAFQENLPSFAVSYGLALQALGRSAISTNLLPREILVQRLIRSKKPWALSMCALLLLGFAFNYVFHGLAWLRANENYQVGGVSWSAAQANVKTLLNTSQQYTEKDTTQQERMNQLETLGEDVVGSVEGRRLMLEMLEAVLNGLPKTEGYELGQTPPRDEIPLDQRGELFIDHIEMEYYPDVASWYNDSIKRLYLEGKTAMAAAPQPDEEEPAEEGAEPSEPAAEEGAEEPPAPADAAPAPDGGDAAAAGDGDVAAGGEKAGPSGEGWVIEIKGYHLHNDRASESQGGQYVRNTLIKYLEQGEVMLPGRIIEGRDPQKEPVKLRDLGISFPTLVTKESIDWNFTVPNPEYVAPVEGAEPPAADQQVPERLKAPKYSFVVQFVWQQTRMTEREKKTEDQTGAPAEPETE